MIESFPDNSRPFPALPPEAKVIGQIHDETVIELPDNPEAVDRLVRDMIANTERVVKAQFLADAKAIGRTEQEALRDWTAYVNDRDKHRVRSN